MMNRRNKWVISKSRWFNSMRDNDVSENDIIELNEEETLEIWTEYDKGGKEFYTENGKLLLRPVASYTDEYYAQQNTNLEALTELRSGDWKVIKELERMFLKDSELNQRREELREKIQPLESN